MKRSLLLAVVTCWLGCVLGGCSGSVGLNSEVPAWSVSINATCSETGKSSTRIVGTISGDT